MSAAAATVAAIHGVCLGGGTELSLACRHRLASDSPKTRIGLPEVQLGILPAWGGTTRLPRLVGLQAALPILLTGEPISGLVVAALVAGLFGFLSGLVVLRTTGLTLIMLTLAVLLLISEFANRARPITGGADVRNDVTGAAMTEYIKEYQRIGTEPVPATEMAMNKRYMAGTFLVTTQLQGAVARQLASNWMIGLPADFLGKFVPLLQKVTPEQVMAVSKTYFNPAEQSWVVVGDAEKIGEQLKAFGEFKVVKP